MTGANVNQVAAAIASAENIADPLAGLAEKTKANPGAPFVPEVLERLSDLKRENRAAYEELRMRLKRTGCRVIALDDAIAKEKGDAGGRSLTHADILIELAADIGLFHTRNGVCYADLEINGHRETWPIRSKGFRRWLTRRFYEVTGGAPNSEAQQSALNVFEARAHFDAAQMDVHIRVAEHNGKLYLDLTDNAWRAVEIDEDGWRIVDEPPIRFRRAAGMESLPVPVSGGSIEMLRDFINVRKDNDFVLIVAWALAVLRSTGPYPIIVLSGEQGSAKSTVAAILRALLDPNFAPLRALPREDRDLFIAATNGHVLTFDNVSRLPTWTSDTLCRLATGGGFAVRQLYTDQDEMLFDAARPVVLNGIEDIVTRSDLADRAIFLTLEPIPEECRRSEKELWSAFDMASPKILGALLDAVSTGLRQLPETRLEKLPRMADFALWVTACEGELWEEGTFMKSYTGNRDEAVDSVIEADPVASVVRAFMTSRTEWMGTATDLSYTLSKEVSGSVRRAKSWQETPRALSGRLRRAATFLRKIGIDISFRREGQMRTRTIHIKRANNFTSSENSWVQPSEPSIPSADLGKRIRGKDSYDATPRTVTPQTVANGDPASHATIRKNDGEYRVEDATDGMDGKIPSHCSCRSTRT